MSTAERTHSGVLEMHPKGYGYLRDPARNFKINTSDVYVGSPLLSRFQLRQGVKLTGLVDEPRRGEGLRLSELIEIEGRTPEQYLGLRGFDDLTVIDPHEVIRLETGPEPLGMRIMDLLTPIGKGQRGLIVAPPRSGKTILLQQMAAAVAKNHPEIHLIVLLIDERPEEVTDMRRSVRGEVIASSSDHAIEEHIRLAQLTVDRAKRIAESGGQVLILLDSLTRLARAYNKGSNSGRTMSGGMDIKALDVPKRLFGAARTFEEGGSLTVLATCLIETGSRMDDLIFQEFKGTGNMECVLDRRLAERRIWPAIDIQQSGTRKEERLLTPETLDRVTLLRRTLAGMKPMEAMEGLVKQLGKCASNAEFLDKIGQSRK
ncbi:transcription termination factor Rho [Tundrisphaera lichenicola]|uniref:transcription termination factor Rho n=1 Tax=Tundrisphaera lichenicola TaxID=2029860 RepID=UPI003EBE5BE0